MSTAARTSLPDLGRRYPLALVGSGVVLYAIGPVFIAATGASGPTISFWRLWFGVGVLGLLTVGAVRVGAAHWPALRSRNGRHAWRYAAWAGVAFGFHQLCFFTAVKATSVTDVVLMNTLSPIVVGVAAVHMFGERTGTRFRAWTVLAIAGAVVVVLGGSTGPEGDPFGMSLAVANVGFFAAFFLLSKRSRDVISVLPFLLGVMLLAALTVSAYALVAGEALGAVTGRDLWFAFIVAAGPGAVGHFVMTWPLRWVAANIPPVMRLAQPAIAGGLAWLLLAQPITVNHLAGGALTIAGVAGALLSPAGRRLRLGGAGADPHPSG